MLLCDIGNSYIKFFKDGIFSSFELNEFDKFIPQERIYYINVNPNIDIKNEKFIDMKEFFSFKTDYKGLGIDRISGCYTVENGVIVDAGTAITVDIMENKKHLGGFIMPGILSTLKSYEDISKRLQMDLNKSVNLLNLPQNTQDAISYGTLKPIILTIKDIVKDKDLYFTGGNGKFLSSFFKNASYDKNLIFKGMLKALKERGISC